jgi:hypothetical protein
MDGVIERLLLLALFSVFCVAYMDVSQGREQELRLCCKSYITAMRPLLRDIGAEDMPDQAVLQKLNIFDKGGIFQD